MGKVKLTKAPSEYANVRLTDNGHEYRVAFHVGTGRPMIVCRQLRARGETLLDLKGPRAAQIVQQARDLTQWRAIRAAGFGSPPLRAVDAGRAAPEAKP